MSVTSWSFLKKSISCTRSIIHKHVKKHVKGTFFRPSGPYFLPTVEKRLARKNQNVQRKTMAIRCPYKTVCSSPLLSTHTHFSSTTHGCFGSGALRRSGSSRGRCRKQTHRVGKVIPVTVPVGDQRAEARAKSLCDTFLSLLRCHDGSTGRQIPVCRASITLPSGRRPPTFVAGRHGTASLSQLQAEVASREALNGQWIQLTKLQPFAPCHRRATVNRKGRDSIIAAHSAGDEASPHLGHADGVPFLVFWHGVE